MRRDRLRNLFLLSFVVLLLMASLYAVSGSAIDKADFSFVNATEVQSLDPQRVSGVPEGRVLRSLFEGLTAPDPKTLIPQPGMAESWRISDDGKTYTFKIRENAKWSDGTRLTSKDFYYSWKRLLIPETAAEYAQLLWYVRGGKDFNEGRTKDFSTVGISAPDNETFVVELEGPVPFFLDLTHFYPLFPVKREIVERFRKNWQKPEHIVSNGAFQLQYRSIRDRIRMVKNEHYWDAANVRLQTVDVFAVESSTTALNLYLTGVVDWITDVPQTVMTKLRERNDFNPYPYLGSYFYRVNLKDKNPKKRRFLGDRRVRLALSLGLDRKAITEKVTRAGELPGYSVTPPGIEGYDPPRVPKEDAEKGRKLIQKVLEEFGWKEAPTLTILYNTSESHKDIAEVIQSQWSKRLGLDIKLENQEWGSYLVAQNKLDYDVSRSAWIGDYADANTFLDMWLTGGGNNRTGFANPEYDALIDAANRELDRKKRIALLRKAEALLMHELPLIPIYYYVTKNMVRPYVKGFYPNVQDVHPIKDIWIDR